MKRVVTDKAPKAIGPYSQAIVYNGTVFVSGQIAINPETNQFNSDNDIDIQTQIIMRNIGSILSEAGCSYKDIIKTEIFVNDIGKFEIVNKIYGEYFQEEHKPARQTIEVSNLPKNAKIEISCIAALNQ